MALYKFRIIIIIIIQVFVLAIFVASCNILNFFALYDVLEIVQFY